MCVGVAAAVCLKAAPAVAQEKGSEHPFNVSVTAGRIDMEGDFATKDGFLSTVRLGYDLNDWWSLEAGVFLAPVLKPQTLYKDRVANPNGEQQFEGDTTGYGVTLDALFHFTPWKRVDPYLSAGVAGIGFTDSFDEDDQWDAAIRAGGGVLYNFNDEWAVRADFRGGIAGVSEKGTVNSAVDVGVRYVFGAHVPPAYVVSGGPKDSDADGLTDEEELQIGTNPHDPDTDKDGLSDFDEVRKFKTDPLNPDTDYDGLKDGVEVFSYKTNPTLRDTDNGGVADGHEVIEDGTNPLDGSDDLQLFELNIQFDYDKDIIKPQYFKDLDVIGKVLHRDPGATARIEGHADKLKKSSKTYNEQLSERRAKACVKYLADKCGIEKDRMVGVGYGFSRPKAANDPVMGNPVNRRVEVYIRKSGMAPAPAAPVTPVDVPPATGPMQ
jgi:outer membrane protein OmpA-like peptidoglycan-associated protein/opacity protein-like surface antigen